MPKVSVIIPVYNPPEKLLRKCLDSICSQTLEDIEIICVDDGSADKSFEILDEYKNKDSRFIVIRQENKGQGAARQRGLETAAGEYLSFVDADDYLSPVMYEHLYTYAKKMDSDIVECDYFEVLDWNKRINPANYIEKLSSKLTDNKITQGKNYNSDNLGNLLLSGQLWKRFYKREFIINNKITSPIIRVFGEDSVFSLNAFFKAEKISFLQENLYYYVVHSSSCMRAWNFVKQIEQFRNNLYEVLKQNNKFCESYKANIDADILATYLYGVEKITSSRKKKEAYKYIKDTLDETEYKKFLALKNENDKKLHRTFWQKVFSVRNSEADAVLRKVITICGIKISFKKKRVED